MTEINTLPIQLVHIELCGFRSISRLELDLTQLDLLIGPNGAGKSSLIDFLRLLGFMLSGSGGLGTFVGRAGGASTLLHDGPKKTREIEAKLSVRTHQGINEYAFRLGYASGDTLIFLEERCRFSSKGRPSNPRWIDFGSGHKAPNILESSDKNVGKTRQTVLNLLKRLSVYHFHDTSVEAPIKQYCRLDDGLYLRSDGRNIASFLYRMRAERFDHYRSVVETIRLIAPFFDDFLLEPEGGHILLRWRERGSDADFGPGQISDGTLRAMALCTLLLQPPQTMPAMLVLDEPELGLHPFAVRIIAGAIRAVSETRQCLVATQSPQFLDEFEPDNIVVVERIGRESRFSRLPSDRLDAWLDDYRLGELWDMNMLGGRPDPSPEV